MWCVYGRSDIGGGASSGACAHENGCSKRKATGLLSARDREFGRPCAALVLVKDVESLKEGGALQGFDGEAWFVAGLGEGRVYPRCSLHIQAP